MLTSESIPATYAVAHQRFVQKAKNLGWELEQMTHTGQGPNSEALNTTVALHRVPNACRTLIASSGIHGVEGHFGSAVQLCWLDQIVKRPPPSVNVVLIHAVNPFGFAWGRRADEGNRDLNRNFLFSSASYSGAPPLYAALDPVLNPRCPPTAFEWFYLRALAAVARHGFSGVQSAIASGQHEYPQGLFYGGSALATVGGWLTNKLPSWLAGQQQVAHFDFHTGLGKWGTCKLLIENELSRKQRQQLDAIHGANSYHEVANATNVYQATGSFGRWCASVSNVPDYFFATAEFGTYRPLSVLAALRAENRCHHWADRESTVYQRAKTRLREVFCPASAQWRAATLARAVRVLDRHIGALAESKRV